MSDTRSRALAEAWFAAACGEGGPAVPAIVCRRQGWGGMQLGTSIAGTPLRLAGSTYGSGLGTHADSEIAVSIANDARRFTALVGVDDNPDCRARSRARVVFRILADGRELWRSRALAVADAPETVDVTIPPGTAGLTLLATAPDGNIDYAHADWAMATLVGDDGRSTRLGDPCRPDGPPVDARIDGRPLSALLPGWERSLAAPRNGDGWLDRSACWRDPASGLELRLDVRAFTGFPAVEWVLHLRNGGANDSPLLEDIQSLAATWSAGATATLHRSRGAPCRIDDFAYQSIPLAPGACERMAGGGGRSSSDWLPFLNLQDGDGGLFVGIGWTGQWAASVSRRDDATMALRAGLELTRLRLHPGEEIRLPRILVLFWSGDRLDAHNLLRRFMLAHHTPRQDGRPIDGPLTVAHWGGMGSADHLERIATYAAHGLAYDYYWIDAGWYGPASSISPDEHTGDWARHVGNWQVNPKAHPHGLRPISDAAGAAGMRFLLWFEPERAICGTPLTIAHPEWFLGERRDGGTLLFDLGNPEARAFLTGFIAGLIREHGVHLYRQDFNMEPLPFWRAADAPERQGMHEIRHIEGLYAFWDELLARFPGLVIDNCASGGRRIDLETCGRSIPLWRSDWQCWWTADAIGGQVHGMGLAHWVPLSGTAVIGGCRRAGDTYNVRSALSAALQFGLFAYESFPIEPDYDYAWHQRMLADHRRIRPLFHGDYYALSTVDADPRQWAMYQLHRPDLGQGAVVAFRRPDSPYRSAGLRLRGLDPAAVYELEDADDGRRWRQGGEALMRQGLDLEMAAAPGSRLVFITRIAPTGA